MFQRALSGSGGGGKLTLLETNTRIATSTTIDTGFKVADAKVIIAKPLTSGYEQFIAYAVLNSPSDVLVNEATSTYVTLDLTGTNIVINVPLWVGRNINFQWDIYG